MVEVPNDYVQFKRGNFGQYSIGENWLIHRQLIKEVYEKRIGKKTQVEVNGIPVCETYDEVKLLIKGEFDSVDEMHDAEKIFPATVDDYDSDFPLGKPTPRSNYNGELN